MSFKDDILAQTGGEKIEAIVISCDEYNLDSEYPESNRRFIATKPHHGNLHTWDFLAEFLDYDYDSGYGGRDCHGIVAWTKNRIIFVHEYDGATSVRWLPRNPMDDKEGTDFYDSICSYDGVHDYPRYPKL